MELLTCHSKDVDYYHIHTPAQIYLSPATRLMTATLKITANPLSPLIHLH